MNRYTYGLVIEAYIVIIYCRVRWSDFHKRITPGLQLIDY